MENNKSELLVDQVNRSVFFSEFTYSQNEFTAGKQKLELADHVVWLDNLFFIFQIKERNPSDESDGAKWFQNKVINKAVKQIKNTINYLDEYSHIPLTNNKGHEFNLSNAKHLQKRKVIVYHPEANFPDEKRNLKFYESSQVGLVHLFHAEDYAWVCQYLQTPAEVEEYFDFREELFEAQRQVIIHLPEQYVLGHFFETLEVDHIDARYINRVNDFNHNSVEEFTISGIITNFTKSIRLAGAATEYYPIIREIAKLKRSELSEFKKRLLKALDDCKSDEVKIPYRIYCPRTDCGFVFIPIPQAFSSKWRTAINNYTMAHKYDQKATKCIGLTVMQVFDPKDHIDMNWLYMEQEWEYDDLLEAELEKNFPFRKVSVKEVKNRYTHPEP